MSRVRQFCLFLSGGHFSRRLCHRACRSDHHHRNEQWQRVHRFSSMYVRFANQHTNIHHHQYVEHNFARIYFDDHQHRLRLAAARQRE
jgi:hypothetical protein